jgi:hypothetical protein
MSAPTHTLRTSCEFPVSIQDSRRTFRSSNKDDASTTLLAFGSVFLRFALVFSFLSAVADRFGFCGSHSCW